MSARFRLRLVALGYLALLLLVPVGLVFYRTFEGGLAPVWEAVTTPAAQHAFWLTIQLALIAVPLNAIFGILAALALVRGRFRGKALLDALIDVPFAVSPVVIGLSLILVYGRDGWIGATLADAGVDRKSTRLNSSHANISYAVFCLKKKNKIKSQN